MLARLIDHAVLSPTATQADVEQACNIGLRYGVASVCVRPSDILLASQLLKGQQTCVSTVIGFPHGTTSTFAKTAESEKAIKEGARELDMVLNIGRLLSGDTDYVAYDIKAVAQLAHQENILLKVILETCYLTDTLIRTACSLAVLAGADYVKTSTGFGTGGATAEAVRLMRSQVPDRIGVKASGGIRSLEQMIQLVDCGATRIGTSATEAIILAARSAANGQHD